MNKKEANERAKEVFEQWQKDREQLEKEAKENGTWQDAGLDSNNHLFKAVDKEAKEKLEKISKMIDE